MTTNNSWNLSTVIIILIVIAIFSLNILLVPWGYFSKEKNTIEWITLIVGTGSLLWTTLLYKFFLYKENNKIKIRLRSTKKYSFNQAQDTQRVIQLLQEKGINQEDIEYRIDGAVNLKDNPNRKIETSPMTLKEKRNKIILIPGFFFARYRKYPKEFASILTHEIAHFQNKDIEIINKVSIFLYSIIIIFFLSMSIRIIASIYVDLQADPNQIIEAIQASIIGKNYLIFQAIFIFVLLLIHKELKIWREALADNEAIKYFGKETLSQAVKLLNSKQDITRASKIHLKNINILSPIWIFISGIIIALFTSRVSGTMNYLLTTSGKTNLLDLADTTNDLLVYSGFFYILATFFKNISSKESRFSELLFASSLLLIMGNYFAFLLLESLPIITTSTLMPEGYDYIYRYNPLTTLISSTQIIFENATIILVALISLFIGHSQQKIYIGYLLGFTLFLCLLIERFYFPHILEGWLSISIFIPIFLFTYKNNHHYTLSIKSSIFIFFIILFAALNYFGFSNINHLSKVQIQLGNQALKDNNISKAIKHYRKTLEIAPHNLDTTIYLMQLLTQNQQINDAINISKKAENTIKYFEPSWNKLYQYYITAGNLRLYRSQAKDLKKAKELYQEATYMYQNNSRLEISYSKELFYNLVCLESKNKNYLTSSAYLLEYFVDFHDNSILKDSDITELLKNIKEIPRASTERLIYLDKIIHETGYEHRASETIQLVKERKITLIDIYTIIKIRYKNIFKQ